ncbi:hypothetical protein FDG2_1829 [Candidatus Protofrankia californiensis]|uniref:Uncharacterized protein n=1 Tax=Candidatus Protofrankia californiensis TaxID=1839754 RepID=A0A1C3NWG5_9ACTN|nr:hypothetical protein FDG2_1829 [Candidatus Protofrankia californiensis]
MNRAVNRPDASVDELLLIADLLLAGRLAVTPAGCHRGASLALRTALEIVVNHALDAAVPGLARTTMRAKMLCLRYYTAAETARRANTVWSHVCLGCHYHQYEIGPTHHQVHSWRQEIADLIQLLTP